MSHPLSERLASRDPGVRADACRSAAADPSAVLFVEALGEALGDSDAEVAYAASEALVEIGAHSDDVAEVLHRELRGDRANARWAAAFATARIAPPGPRLIPPLVEALAVDAGEVRWRAARLLTQISQVVAEVHPLVLGLASDDPRPAVRQMAVHCLREIAPDDEETARVLLAVTRDGEVKVRRAALAALAALGEPRPAVSERLLEAAIGDDDAASRRVAVAALGEIAGRAPEAIPKQATARLRQLATAADDRELRNASARVLRRLAAESPPETPPQNNRRSRE